MTKLGTDIKFLKGVGDKRAELLNKELGMRSFEDLALHFPIRYVDKSRLYTIRELSPDLAHVQVKGKIVHFASVGSGPKMRLVARFTDGRDFLSLVWFRGLDWIRKSITPNTEYVVFGKPNLFRSEFQIVHPEVQTIEEFEAEGTPYEPVYPSTELLKKKYINSKAFRKLVFHLFEKIDPEDFKEFFPPRVLEGMRLLPREQAMRNIHFPENPDMLERARFRLKFEELFFIQLGILRLQARRNKQTRGLVFAEVGELFHGFYNTSLPFSLTAAQKRVVKEIRHDMKSGKQMNRLLQGDVGSGKTLAALMAMLIALDNGFQVALMAPTEILANQHYKTFAQFLEGLPVQTALLKGSTKTAARRQIHEDLRSGKLQILMGTHALIEDEVQFHKLGLVVIDEQHRFGVAQRARLGKKAEIPPHIIVMTATPIPRTLSMTVYGDLDVSVIDELPPGRKPVKTLHATDAMRARVFGFLRRQVAKGRQVYIVYPLISESEKLDLKNLEEGYESIQRAFPYPQYQVGIVHGQQRTQDKDKEMQRFATGQTHILVATTVIEVGVDVPNASVMVIENAERFGLSQLHQLRGRVGRGAEQSYCVLMSKDKVSDEGKRRIQAMVQSNDGFVLAEEDMKMRGPGDIEGTQQSGVPFNLKLASLKDDTDLLQQARNVAAAILEKDPLLEKEENQGLVEQLNKLKRSKTDWSKVS